MENELLSCKCPVCKAGHILPTDDGYECYMDLHQYNPCDFTIKKKIRGVTITDELVKELCANGRTRTLKFLNDKGKQYLAHLVVSDGKVEVIAEAKYLNNRCPHCGGRILVTGKGYFCENTFGRHPTCKFHCNGILSHRLVTPDEIDAYLGGHPTILDGCFNSQGRIFSAKLTENETHGMSLTSVVGKCPLCGEDFLVSPVAFNCTGHHQVGEPYHLSLWRNIRGHSVTLDELNELLTNGITSNEVVLYSETGSLSKAYLRLSDDKKNIVPDFETSNAGLDIKG